jgi:hypothetical protein
MAVTERSRADRLTGSDGFRVETPKGRLGIVEEVWVGADDEPEALAVRTVDGRHGLLLADEVDAVLAEEKQIVVEEPHLLELDAPRLDDKPEGAPGLTASWATTGEVLTVFEPRTSSAAERVEALSEGPIWRSVAILYGGIAFLVVLLITLTFVISLLVAGRPY